MTYANAVLPHALFVAAEHWPKEEFLEVAKASFAFLDRQTTWRKGVRPHLCEAGHRPELVEGRSANGVYPFPPAARGFGR